MDRRTHAARLYADRREPLTAGPDRTIRRVIDAPGEVFRRRRRFSGPVGHEPSNEIASAIAKIVTAAAEARQSKPETLLDSFARLAQILVCHGDRWLEKSRPATDNHSDEECAFLGW